MIDGAETLVISFLVPVLRIEWGLSDSEAALLGSSPFIGFFIGCLFSGQLSDRFGRKKPLFIFLAINIIFAICSFFAFSYTSLVIFRLFFGLSTGTISTICMTHFIEIIPLENRGKWVVFVMLFWTTGELVTCLIAYVFYNSVIDGNWRILAIWSIFPITSALFLGICVMEESPRYLLINGKFDEGFDVIGKILRRNYKKGDKALGEEEIMGIRLWVKQQEKFQNVGESADPLELFRENRAKITVLLWVNWYVLSCVYFGSLFILPEILHNMNMEGEKEFFNEFLGIFVSILCELPSTFISFLIVDREAFGRKKSLIVAIFLMSAAFFSGFWMRGLAFLILATLARFFQNIAYLMNFPLTTEIYPTFIRVTGLGFDNSFSRIGQITMPWISIQFMKIGITGPFLIYSILGLFAGVCSIFIPYDTVKRELDKFQAEEDNEEKCLTEDQG